MAPDKAKAGEKRDAESEPASEAKLAKTNEAETPGEAKQAAEAGLKETTTEGEAHAVEGEPIKAADPSSGETVTHAQEEKPEDAAKAGAGDPLLEAADAASNGDKVPEKAGEPQAGDAEEETKEDENVKEDKAE